MDTKPPASRNRKIINMIKVDMNPYLGKVNVSSFIKDELFRRSDGQGKNKFISRTLR